MFVNNIDPVLFRIGIFQIRYYGIVFALGFIITYLFLKYFVKKKKISKLDTKNLDNLLLYLIIGIVLGARLFYFIFYRPSEILSDPSEIFMVWHGGLSFHGGFIGGIFASWFFCKKYKVDLLSIADASVIPASLALALGRIANFTNQELYGYVTDVPWCVVFTSIDNLCRHPYQVYAALSHLLMFIILIHVYKDQKTKGTSFWAFVFLYGILRFITDFFRVESRFLGISTGQYLSLIMVIISWIIIVKKELIVFHSGSKDKT